MDRFGKTHFKKDATQAEKDAASEDVRNAGERAAQRHPDKADTIKRNNEAIGAAKKADDAAVKATANEKATTAQKQTATGAAKARTQAKMDAF
ncbi:hypothetical protein ACYCVF_35490 [Bradyrhizobium sp. 1.29L]